MKATVLIENTAPDGLTAEWGLSFFIEYRGANYLMDMGSTSAFADNARRMHLDLCKIDAAVLSHAHYDHCGGLDAFCAQNNSALIYLQRSACENCYSWHHRFPKYIGIQKGALKRQKERLIRISERTEIAPGVTLLPHSEPQRWRKGKSAQMYLRKGPLLLPDAFQHEQNLVFDTDEGLVVFSSCSHSGVDSILDEVTTAFPNRPIRAIIGGFHLVRTPPREVRLLAKRLKAMHVPDLYTGHCTGEDAIRILSEALPGRVHPLTTGMQFEISEGER